MRIRFLAAVGLTLTASTFASAPAVADVLSSSPSGFVIRIEVSVAATPADAYSKFFEVGRWWSDDHTYSGKASNMTIRNEPGGCFCEALPEGGFVRHASVEYSARGKAVRLAGALGPLQELGAHGLLAFNFTADKTSPAANPGPGTGTGQSTSATRTRLIATYIVSGYQPDKGFAPLAEPVNGVLGEQVARFRRYVETGKPTAP